MLCFMNKLYLTEQQKSELELRHRYCQDRKEGDRIKAVLLFSEGLHICMNLITQLHDLDQRFA